MIPEARTLVSEEIWYQGDKIHFDPNIIVFKEPGTFVSGSFKKKGTIMKHNGKEYIEGDKHDFDELREIITILRSENGCKWDREQTLESLKKCLKDETEEVFEAIDNDDHENLCEELGDVLLQVLLQSEIASENGWFTMDDVIQMLSEKMIRRHPHVFGDAVANTPEESLALWRAVKAKEKEAKRLAKLQK